jgi:ABC-2 type transport system ATP-binding protein
LRGLFFPEPPHSELTVYSNLARIRFEALRLAQHHPRPDFLREEGEIVGFLGPNGAGKTTTMRMIAGFTTATSGRVFVAGYDMATQNEEAARISGTFRATSALRCAGSCGLSAIRGESERYCGPRRPGELDRVIQACRLEAVVTREIYKLSKGYRQRVGLAQSLLGDPDVLLLDEPTAGLDPGQIQETREVIRLFGENHAVLLSTHILPEVTLICQRVAIINDGRLLAIDSPEGLQRASEQSNRVSLLVAGPEYAVRQAIVAIDGVISVDVRPAADGSDLLSVDCHVEARAGIEAAIAKAVAGRWSLHRLERQQPTLENIFLRYVGVPPDSRNAA